jgi:hypothetical protein
MDWPFRYSVALLRRRGLIIERPPYRSKVSQSAELIRVPYGTLTERPVSRNRMAHHAVQSCARLDVQGRPRTCVPYATRIQSRRAANHR